MILEEQSQKQNELEPPGREQMAHNCLVEEARESILTGLRGVAVAKSAAGNSPAQSVVHHTAHFLVFCQYIIVPRQQRKTETLENAHKFPSINIVSYC